MPERRRFARTKVYKGAKLILADRVPVDCIVRNLSSQGACLDHLSVADLPAEFELTFDTGYTLRKCRVVWQNLTKVGVSFEQPIEG